MQEVIAWVWGSVGHGNAIEQYSWALSVLTRILLPEGTACGRGNLEASCLLLHVLVACRRLVAASLRGGHAVLPGYSVWGGFVSFKIRTQLLLYSCVVHHVRVWVLQRVGLCTVSGEPVQGQASSVSRCARAGHSFFSSVHSTDTERAWYYGFQGPLYLFDPCRPGLFLAYCAKGSNRSNFSWIRLPRWPWCEIASYLYNPCKHVSFPPDSVLPPEFLIVFFVFIPYHQKEFQFFRCLRLSRMLGMSSESFTMLLVACVVSQRAGGFRRSWQFAKLAARGGCGSSMARGHFGSFDPRISGTGRLSNLPMRWRCAARVLCWLHFCSYECVLPSTTLVRQSTRG